MEMAKALEKCDLLWGAEGGGFRLAIIVMT